MSPSCPRVAGWTRSAVCRWQPPHPRLDARPTAGCPRPPTGRRCGCG
jgi:hypothetical protein